MGVGPTDNEVQRECMILMRPMKMHDNELMVWLKNFMRAADGNHVCLFPGPNGRFII